MVSYGPERIWAVMRAKFVSRSLILCELFQLPMWLKSISAPLPTPANLRLLWLGPSSNVVYATCLAAFSALPCNTPAKPDQGSESVRLRAGISFDFRSLGRVSRLAGESGISAGKRIRVSFLLPGVLGTRTTIHHLLHFACFGKNPERAKVPKMDASIGRELARVHGDETVMASGHLFYFKPEPVHYIGIDFDPRPRYRGTMHPMPANVAHPEYLATFSEIRVPSSQGK